MEKDRSAGWVWNIKYGIEEAKNLTLLSYITQRLILYICIYVEKLLWNAMEGFEFLCA